MSEVRPRSKSVSFRLKDASSVVYPETARSEGPVAATAGVAFIDGERTALFLARGPGGLLGDVSGPVTPGEPLAAAARRDAQERLSLPAEALDDFLALLVEAVHLSDDHQNHTCFLLELPPGAASSPSLVRVPLSRCKELAATTGLRQDGAVLAPQFAAVLRRSAVIELCAARLPQAARLPAVATLSADVGSLTEPSSAADGLTPTNESALWLRRLSDESADAAGDDQRPADCMPCAVM